MIQKFVDRFMSSEAEIRESIRKDRPHSYGELARLVIEFISLGVDGIYTSDPDPERITIIDHGDYQGTLLFIIGAKCYQPSQYWSIFVSYGSCSWCDTFEAVVSDIQYDDDGNEKITDEVVQGFWTMALHMIQSMDEV